MTSDWRTLNAAIAEANDLITSAAPDQATASEGKAYVARVVTAGLDSALLGHLFRENGLSQALPCYGGPNPDYRMYHSPVDPVREYCLAGRLNGSERVGVGLYRYGGNSTLLEVGYAAFDAGNCSADGTFSLNISADAAGPGALAIQPGTQIMLIRVLHRDASAPSAQLALAGTPPASDLTLMSGSINGALGFVAASLGATVHEYLKWTRVAYDLRNRLDEVPAELAQTVQGDPDTRYFLGGFSLGEGEWLEVTMPAGLTGYWSLHAYNFWFEHLQTFGMDDRTAKPDDDGQIRIAIGPTLPRSVRNPIDTLGRTKGALICRIIGGGACPSSTVQNTGK